MHHDNHQVKEAILRFRFEPGSLSVLEAFQELKQAIEAEGFIYEREQRTFQVSFTFSAGDSGQELTPKVSHNPQQVLFKKGTYGVIISDRESSFHALEPYLGWEKFLEDGVKPVLDILYKLSLYDSLTSGQMAYVNQFEIDLSKEAVSKFLRYAVEPLPDSVDLVQNQQAIIQYSTGHELNATSQIIKNETAEECQLLLICAASLEKADDWGAALELAQDLHDKANELFSHVVTDYTKEFISTAK